MTPAVIYVAVLTYKRPETLARLLDALLELELPDAQVHFLVVDNDPAASARAAFDAFSARVKGATAHYAVEPSPGIPPGRNRALRIAVEGGGRFLCFTDDDAFPSPKWLIHLLRCQRAQNAPLVVGPVRLIPPTGLIGPRKWLAASLVARARFIERHAIRRWKNGVVITSATSNWLGELDWITRNGLQFDDTLGAGGGEDTAFFDAVVARGGHPAWCEHAIVFEHLHAARVSIRYQYRRARDNGINIEQLGRTPHLAILRNPLGRMLSGIALMLVPAFGVASFALGLQQLGLGIGILRARRGARSNLYSR